ncbi:hypothetical protein T439DRAFT_347151 [Meredithblackwellia eburnea MCA 4105]
MPHKRAKKSIRDSDTARRGYDNPPMAQDSQLPALGKGVLAPKHTDDDGEGAEKRSNKRRKKILPKDKVNSFGGREDMAGLSKSAYRILNAGTLRDEYHAKKKREREEEELAASKKGKGKQKLQMLPHETLSAFNRRVEVAMRPTIDSAIRGAKLSSAKGRKDKDKAKKEKQEADTEALKQKEEEEREEEEAERERKRRKKGGAEPKDPFVPAPKPQPILEFAVASQRKSVGDVVNAPPILQKAVRGLEAGPSAHLPIPVGRLPVSASIKAMMEQEREKAVRMYRELKEKREKDQQAGRP